MGNRTGNLDGDGRRDLTFVNKILFLLIKFEKFSLFYFLCFYKTGNLKNH